MWPPCWESWDSYSTWTRSRIFGPLLGLTANIVGKLSQSGVQLTHGNIDLSQHQLRQWLVASRHQAITWTNVDVSLLKFYGIHQRAGFTASAQATFLYDEFEICT